ncbi:hypothetical protein JRO89_XS06G0222200 [Xanthoceras sorbifolium]|uniref:Uncharacterized protein n=1 Tax=Xanthoceras sorbifolium TaxID=99658 RepID=A0ABQ8HZ41_9ROSI|nr:hypothetical protein JRO89_XS06G0222200 [Xanthoceras sorbifolium]
MSEILNYIRETSSKNGNFHIAIERAKSIGKEVTAEVIPSKQDLEFKWEHWYNTAGLFKIALDLKEEFFELESIDSDLKSRNLTKEQWDQARVIHECSEDVTDTAFCNHWRNYKTANMYFPVICSLYTKSLMLKKHEVWLCYWLGFKSEADKYWFKSEADKYCVISFIERENWFSGHGIRVDPVDYICDIYDKVLDIIKGCLCNYMSEILNYIRKISSKNGNFHIAIERAKFLGNEVTAEVIPSNQYLELKWEYWFNTAGLFKIVLDVKVAFFELESMDPNFKSKNLTKEQWDQAKVIDECYEDLTDTAFLNHWRNNQTANMYFSIICRLFTKSLMFKKHEVWLCYWFGFKSEADKYWRVYKLVLAVVVLSVVMKEKTNLVISVLMKEKTGLVVKVYALIPLIIFVTSVMKETSSKNENFHIAIERAKSMGKEVTAEVIVSQQDLKLKWEHWCNTVGPFKIAMDIKKIFFEFESMDPDFKSKNLTKDQWDQARVIHKCNEHLTDTAFLNHWREISSKSGNFHIAIERAKSLGKEVTAEVIPSKQDLELKWEHWCNTTGLLKIALDLKEAFFELESVDPYFKIGIEIAKSLGKEMTVEVIPSMQDLELKCCNERENWFSGQGLRVDPIDYICDICDEILNIIQGCLYNCISEVLDYNWVRSSKNENFYIVIERAKYLGKEVIAEVIPWKQDLELKWEHWCNTMGLLNIALDLKKVFFELESLDPYVKSRNLTKEQWIRVIHECYEDLTYTAFLNHWKNYQMVNMYFLVICSLFMKSLMLKKHEVWLCYLFRFKVRWTNIERAELLGKEMTAEVIPLNQYLELKWEYWFNTAERAKSLGKEVTAEVIPSKQDLELKWEHWCNTTGLLKIALDLKEAFFGLESVDPYFKTGIEIAKSLGKEVTAEVIPSMQDLELKWERWCDTAGFLKIALDFKEVFFESLIYEIAYVEETRSLVMFFVRVQKYGGQILVCIQIGSSCCSVISCNERENWFSGQGLRVDPIDYICDICDEILDIIQGCLYNCMSEVLNYNRVRSSKNGNFHIAIQRAKYLGKEVIAEVIPWKQDLELKWEHWCNTMGLLNIALDLKKVFFELESMDPYFKSRNLTKEQWIRVIHECYKDLTYTAFLNRWKNYPMVNMYFPVICCLFTKSLMLKKHEVWLCYLFGFKVRWTNIERAKSLGKEVTTEVIPWKQDLELRWEHWCNTTGLSKIALDLKEAFLELMSMDPDFKSSNLTNEQWYQARVIHECSDYLTDTVFLNHWRIY